MIVGWDGSDRISTLQRGRARESAEIPPTCCKGWFATSLQRGRARESAEIARVFLADSVTNELQRGRARESAEMYENNRN